MAAGAKTAGIVWNDLSFRSTSIIPVFSFKVCTSVEKGL